ncbi:MAG: DUF3352 domain-containing protein [bacterium]|nr:DUF3352 domain-containing protein [bacterium]
MSRIRLFSLFCLLFVLAAAPLAAQDAADSPLIAWVPADFDGFIRISAPDPFEALQGINILRVMASYFQPSRIPPPQDNSFEGYFAFETFGIGGGTFTDNVLSWADGEIVIAYRRLSPSLTAIPGDVVLIVSASDSFAAVAALRSMIGADTPPRTVGGVSLYENERAAIAFVPGAVLIGTGDGVQAVLNAHANGETTAADLAYQAVTVALPADHTVYAYVRGAAARAAIPVITSTDPQIGGLILNTYSAAIRAVRADGALDSALIGREVDAIGAALTYAFTGANLSTLTGTAALYLSEPVPAEPPAFDPAVLNAIPRGAMLAAAGADGRAAVQNVLIGLPLYQFAGLALDGFPITASQAAQMGAITPPTSADVQGALSSFLAVMRDRAGIDLQRELIDPLNGSYALALLARPNNPTPVINASFDVLVAAQTETPEGMRDSLRRAAEAFLGEAAFTESERDGVTVYTLETPNGESVFSAAAADRLVILGTGTAVEQALDALNGGERLVEQAGWAAVSTTFSPALYIDMDAYYNTQVREALGGLAGGVPVQYVSATGALVEGQVYRIDVFAHLVID